MINTSKLQTWIFTATCKINKYCHMRRVKQVWWVYHALCFSKNKTTTVLITHIINTFFYFYYFLVFHYFPLNLLHVLWATKKEKQKSSKITNIFFLFIYIFFKIVKIQSSVWSKVSGFSTWVYFFPSSSSFRSAFLV